MHPALLEISKIPRIIELKTTRPDLALPSADYLNIHATCCQVYHMSGAAEYFDQLYAVDDDLAVSDAAPID